MRIYIALIILVFLLSCSKQSIKIEKRFKVIKTAPSSWAWNDGRNSIGLIRLDNNFKLDSIRVVDIDSNTMDYTSYGQIRSKNPITVQEFWSKNLTSNLIINKMVYINLKEQMPISENDNFIFSGASGREHLDCWFWFAPKRYEATLYKWEDYERQNANAKKLDSLVQNCSKNAYICGTSRMDILWQGIVVQLYQEDADSVLKNWTNQ